MMVSRSIDFAKTASIDMMTLNNKVVKMRQVVKQTKVHVISKLCKHIDSLKKKKGTDEQKAKNLRKAQRFIDEIDSMKKLKNDKVSKYALANTSSFNETSKISLSPGPRALARLADHPLLKKVVTEFREQHSDWRDLAAYLLIKQTGRRFKTEKQKQQKLDKCVENIHASETMTKAYIKERFGQEGLTKAELRFERKRKRPKKTTIPGSGDTLGVDSKRRRSCLGSDGNSVEDSVPNKMEMQTSEKGETIENSVVEEVEKMKRVNKMVGENIVKHESEVAGESDEDEVEALRSNNKTISTKKSNQSVKKNTILPQHDESDEDSSSVNSESDNVEDSDPKAGTLVSESHTSDVEQTPVRSSQGKTKLKSECVVNNLKLASTSDDDSDDPSSSESEDDGSEVDAQSSSSGHQIEDDSGIAFCMKASKQLSDSYFNGAVNVEAEMLKNDDNVSDDEFGSGSYKTKPIFNSSHFRGTNSASSKWSNRGRGRTGGFERRGPPGKFDTGQRERSFRNDGRGRGAGFVGAGRGGNVRKFTPQQNYDKRGNKDFDKQSFTTDRFGRKNVAELETSHQAHTGAASVKMPQEKLHPSWEASKKRKEQCSLQAFKGSKITFDDDDD